MHIPPCLTCDVAPDSSYYITDSAKGHGTVTHPPMAFIA